MIHTLSRRKYPSRGSTSDTAFKLIFPASSCIFCFVSFKTDFLTLFRTCFYQGFEDSTQCYFQFHNNLWDLQIENFFDTGLINIKVWFIYCCQIRTLCGTTSFWGRLWNRCLVLISELWTIVAIILNIAFLWFICDFSSFGLWIICWLNFLTLEQKTARMKWKIWAVSFQANWFGRNTWTKNS